VSQPKRASELIKGILASARTSANRGALNQALETVLGPELCQHCQVLSFRSGKLILQVDSAPLYADLSGFRSEEIRKGINDNLDKQKIAQIVFRMGGTGNA
jgi:hypothetical protein